MTKEAIINGIRGENGKRGKEQAILYLKEKGWATFEAWLGEDFEKQHHTEATLREGLTLLIWHVEKNDIDFEDKFFDCLQNIFISVWLLKENSVATAKYIDELQEKAKHYLRKRKVSEAEIEDIIQMGYERLLINIHRRKFLGKSMVSTYLNSICYNIYRGRRNLRYRYLDVSPLEDVPEMPDSNIDMLNEWREEEARKEWLNDQVGSLRTNCKDILKDWAAGVATSKMKEKYNFSTEAVVHVRVNACKNNLKKKIFSKAGEDCQKLLLAFFDKRRKQKDQEKFYSNLVAEFNFENEEALISQLDQCMKKLGGELFL